MPDINHEKVCHVIVKARQFDAKEGVVEEDRGSNPIDEEFRSVLADHRNDATLHELSEYIRACNIDEQCQLVALAWIGCGDFSSGEWNEALGAARARHIEHTSEYLLGMPVLADLLEEGLAAMGLSCESFEKQYL